jgi:hypothetical protein
MNKPPFTSTELSEDIIAAASLTDKSSTINLHQTMDANVWTKEFLKTFQRLYPDIHPNCTKAERFDDFSEFVHSWFCNVIMTGWDHAHWEMDKRYVYILKSNSGSIVKIWNSGIEPDEREMREAYQEYLKCEELPDVSYNCTLYRYNKHEGIQHWNGKIQLETKYNWSNQ